MSMFRFSSWIALWPVAIGLFLYPINNLITRTALVICLAGLWTGGLYFGWNKKQFRAGFLTVSALVVVFLFCPGRTYDPNRLRKDYVDSLRSFEGTRYVWGGENSWGIDCSGLIRAGLIKADLYEGLVTANPRLVRSAVSLWWHDCTAQALGDGYRNQTRLLLTAASIDGLDADKLLPGDIAVTANGVHVLACLGSKEWIEADPGFSKVIIVKAPSQENPWFQQPVKIMRWVPLDDNQRSARAALPSPRL